MVGTKFFFLLTVVICVLFHTTSVAAAAATAAEESNGTRTATNSSDELVHRIKRYLIFNNGGLVKNVLGILIPVEFGDNSKRSLNLGYNFQSQYLVPPMPISIFKTPFFTGLSRNSRTLSRNGASDESRKLVYNALESTWENLGRNGRECILKAICEVAESPFAHNGLFGEIVDAIFTPHVEGEGENVEKLQAADLDDSDFYNARRAGENHADCQKTYSRCPPGEGFLDSISHFFD